jgi:diacylglycerol O-acyltransferase / wax synthase
MSYHGRLGFGLLGDYDAMPDLEDLGADLERAVDALSAATKAKAKAKGTVRRPARARKPSPTTPAAT